MIIIVLVPDSVSMLHFHYRFGLAVQWCECIVLHRKILLYSDYTGSGQSRGSKHQLQRPQRADTALRYTTYTTYIELVTRPKYVNSC